MSGKNPQVTGSSVNLEARLASMIRQGQLSDISPMRLELVATGLDTAPGAELICRDLSAFNRAVIRAVLAVHAQEHPWLHACSFLEFGSGGRDEQVLGSDQDNGLLLHGHVDEDEVEEVAQSIVVSLDGAGLPLCDGGVMVSNAEWRGDFDCWLNRLTHWLSNPVEQGPWQSGLILDFKSVFGSVDEAMALRKRLWEYVRTKPLVLATLVGELTDYRMPLTFYGAFVTEKTGLWQGYINIKKSVLAHMTNAVRILALKYDVHAHHTCDRLRTLAAQGHIGAAQGEQLLAAWDYLQGKRLRIGLECGRDSIAPHAYVMPAGLSGEESATLRGSIRVVEKLVRLVQAGVGL